MNFGEKLYTELKNIKTKCITNKKNNKKEKEIIYSILEIQKKTGLNINTLKDLIIKYSKTVINDKNNTKSKKQNIETFEDYHDIHNPKEIYINSENRGFNNYDIFNQALNNI